MTIAIIILFVLFIIQFIALASYISIHSRQLKSIECRLKSLKDWAFENNKDAQHHFKELLAVTKELAEKSGYTITHSTEEELNPFAPFFKKPLIKTICQLHLEKFKKLKVKKGK